jgi:spermidine synthase
VRGPAVAHHGPGGEPPVAGSERRGALLLACTLVIAVCGLVYELLAGTVSSYLVGDSVYQFSLVIGLFMAAMGLGSFLSRYAERALVDVFVTVQVAVGVIGGASAPALFFAFAYIESYTPFLVLFAVLVGALIGVEIPIVIRILRPYQVLRLNVSNVLTVDYAGALLAALLFPLVLVPQLGLVRTGLVFGLLNLGVAGLALWAFRRDVRRPVVLAVTVCTCAAVLGLAFVAAERLTGFFESRLYGGEIVLAESSPYQRIVITRSGSAISLFLNGGLQFSTLDEHRYHESLVLPAMALARRRERVLILGGGDGMALREVLRHPGVASVTLVDLDPRVVELFSRNPMLARLNGGAFDDPRVRVVNEDAWKYLERSEQRHDVIVIDLPDPHDVDLSRLYTKGFYALAARRLNADGLLVTQATSPTFAREAFWCIERTLAETPSPYESGSGLATIPYHAYVPSFGDWGFVLASARRLDWEGLRLEVQTRFVSADVARGMIHFPPDAARVEVEPNLLHTHALVRYYELGWGRWYE